MSDFFANQDAARRQTGRLVLLFVLAVAAIVAAIDLIIGVALKMSGTPPVASVFVWATGVTLAVITMGTLREVFNVASGGAAVARSLGARQISADTRDPAERRLMNVVEEMAIASGIAVPQVFVMDQERGINAFAAGFSPNEAAVTVTRGALDALNRDELQGVIGHEFSHILNGDMRLNMKLMGVLGGILVLTILGRMLTNVSSRSEKSGLPFVVLSIGLIAIGYIGVFFGRLIQAGVSRQREFLADASSVQFTRNPDGIGRALAKISQAMGGALIQHANAEKASHMFFGEAVTVKLDDWMATHPPVAERLHKIYGREIAPNEIVEHSARLEPSPQPASTASAFTGSYEWGHGVDKSQERDAKTSVVADAAAVASAIGTVTTRHMDYATSLLNALPAQLRESVRTVEGAKLAMYGSVLDVIGATKPVQAQMLSAAGIDADTAFNVASQVRSLDKKMRLPLITLAIPVLKTLPEPEQLEFLTVLRQLIEADRLVTFDEFVINALLTAALDEKAALAVTIKYNSIEQVAEDARLVLSLFAHIAKNETQKTFDLGAKELGLALTLMEGNAMSSVAVTQALSRLNQLAPLQKPRLIKALVQVALADGRLLLTEAELLRAVCATIDCPLPPFVETLEYS